MITVHFYEHDEYGYRQDLLLSTRRFADLDSAQYELEKAGFEQVKLFTYYKPNGGNGILARIINV